jgi:hypothetical protein
MNITKNNIDALNAVVTIEILNTKILKKITKLKKKRHYTRF